MKNKLIKINNIRLQNFLGERGIEPVYEDDYTEAAYYKRCKELSRLLESFDIVSSFYKGV